MGLMGPSWSWDEIQKKDAIMGELKKENDRVLDKQRKENNRVIKELNNNSSLSSSASSKRSDHSLTPDDYAFLHEYKQKESLANSKTNSAIMASKNRLNILKFYWTGLLGDLFTLAVVLFLSLITHKITILFIIFLIITLICTYNLIYSVIRYILLIDDKQTRMLKNTDCYKQILKSIQNLNLYKIKMMEINSLFISVYDIDGKRTEYRYSTYNFPELPPLKHGILLGSLVYDLGLNKDYKFSCEINGYLKVENIKLIAKLEKEKKILEKQKLKEKNNAMKNGKTW